MEEGYDVVGFVSNEFVVWPDEGQFHWLSVGSFWRCVGSACIQDRPCVQCPPIFLGTNVVVHEVDCRRYTFLPMICIV